MFDQLARQESQSGCADTKTAECGEEYSNKLAKHFRIVQQQTCRRLSTAPEKHPGANRSHYRSVSCPRSICCLNPARHASAVRVRTSDIQSFIARAAQLLQEIDTEIGRASCRERV